MVEQGCEHRSRRAYAGDDRGGGVARLARRAGHLRGGLAEAPEHVRGDDLRIGRVRSADADPHAPKSLLPSSRLSDLSPLCPASPPPTRVRTSPKGRSISSWITSTRSRGTRKAPRAGPTLRPASFMWVSGSSSAIRGPPAPARPSRNRPRKRSRAAGAPSGRELRRDGKADVVTRALILATRVAKPDDEPVDRGTAREAQELLALVARRRVGGRLPSPSSAAGPPRLADQAGLLLDLSSSSSRRRRGGAQRRDHDLVEVAQQRDALGRARTPRGAACRRSTSPKRRG